MVLGFTVPKFIYIKLNSFQIFICNHYFPKYAFKTNKKKTKGIPVEGIHSIHFTPQGHNAEVSSTIAHFININILSSK